MKAIRHFNPIFWLRSFWRKFAGLTIKQKLAIILIPSFIIGVVLPLATYAYFARDIADPERLMNRNNTGIVLVDQNGQEIYSSGRSKTVKNIPLSEIPDHLEKAVIASEDKNFYEHNGFSIRGILGALYSNILNRDATRYGGSTLTQQLVKNTLLSNEKSFLRKYQELSISIAVDRQYDKDKILEMYLNSVYYGENAFGIEEAAKTYFNKTTSELTLAESAMLIGVLPAPSAYSPISGDPELAKERQGVVLKRMVEEGSITEAEKKATEAVELAYAPAEQTDTKAPHFVQMVISELNERYGEERVARSGYKVTTSLNLDWQAKAEQAMADRMPANRRAGGSNASLVAIDPKTGQLKALIGSADFNDPDFGKVNMAITPRQPGSSFKPIYYTEALAQRLITPATIMEDKSKSYGSYKPENYDFRYRGDITIRNALGQSLNIPSVDVMEELGVDESIDVAQRMGIETIKDDRDYGLPLALGSGEARLLDMTNAYAAFANAGNQFDPVMILDIKNKYDQTIFTSDSSSKRVQSEQASFLISDILSDNAARAPTFGSALNIAGKDVAVKTGTTDENKDAWTIGYTPGLTVGVWVGNNDNTVMSGGGSGFAGPIWRGTMQRILADMPNEEFRQPSGVERAMICRSNGLRANQMFDGVYNEFFITGTAPSGRCEAPKKEEKPEEKKEERTPTPTPTPTPRRGGERLPNQEDQEDQDDQEEDTLTEPTAPTTPTTPPAPTQPQQNSGSGNGGGNGSGSGSGRTPGIIPLI
ncbi:penicillin-binding protein [Candidatus Saccharibacteria bacterium]|nr:MAG: penicillin-binding protein [Candidatus Saccharibacteria bacterium]